MSRLRITEVFYSLQGETSTTGLPTLFVRLTGCPLRCVWCDTEYSFSGGDYIELAQLLEQIDGHAPQYITVTGGEPLAQKAGCEALISELCDKGYKVSIETSGAMDIAGVDQRAVVVMDLKAPDSGEMARNRLENIPLLKANDEVKFVIASRRDYDWSRMMLSEHKLTERCSVLFSPVHGELEPRQLADWIVADNLPVRFQLQLHKLLWNDQPGH
ncbi:MAG: 7-carboxy-7-deazaguanine synthase QueE [Kangiellaceae bacterium]|nr:7-carboxy-7-deazaguanine synthase QueE [Kangiellaceae bacterium]